jgi:hypothetical protein
VITIKTIKALYNEGLLKDCTFLSKDSSLTSISIVNGILKFDALRKENEILINNISSEELQRINDENDYYLISEHKEDD